MNKYLMYIVGAMVVAYVVLMVLGTYSIQLLTEMSGG